VNIYAWCRLAACGLEFIEVSRPNHDKDELGDTFELSALSVQQL
jgi:hypothetical protein